MRDEVKRIFENACLECGVYMLSIEWYDTLPAHPLLGYPIVYVNAESIPDYPHAVFLFTKDVVSNKGASFVSDTDWIERCLNSEAPYETTEGELIHVNLRDELIHQITAVTHQLKQGGEW